MSQVEKTQEELVHEFLTRMPKSSFEAFESFSELEASSTSSYLTSLLEMFNAFLADYVVLPEKKVVMAAFSSFLDTVMPSLPFSTFSKIVVRRVAMSLAEAAYDAVVKYRNSVK